MAKPVGHLTDFTKAKESDLHKFEYLTTVT